MKALEFLNVTFGYEKEPVIENVSLTVEKGDFFGIVGPNGAGKSTLLKLAAGLAKPWSGKIMVFGKENVKAGKKIGYVPQKPPSEKRFPATVSEIVAMGLKPFPSWKGMERWQKEKVDRILMEVGLEEKKDEMVGNLSGGQLQRVLLAKALVGEPELLLLDEPTNDIDAAFQEKFCCLLERIHESGTTIVLVSHDLTFMSYLVNKVACINKRVYFCGKAASLADAEGIRGAYGHDVKIIKHRHPHE
ncbi:MAG: metal ABC transporter ATP-binding protein [Candidatus Micrarchaeota archaeon]|nr:metal ABC transporter ATP-binding protein [Candidatus Micrarchaeota archaeon]